ncbi:uncharacterized protein C6orf106 homolog [Cimex lectularius]|uniref:Nbr1 FW domain-containing protein n=1 Tax=Cimex lectularius TaxID=79782 RepID=A0A8I6TJ18_CIMLE|nr:uncharacterized protein C6orf106 homolog [Cimex lectularius]
MDSGDLVNQQLLQQFSCLGTTDKEELIQQFQVLVGNNLSPSTAKFYLDMNNWNLQAAVGSYFDLFVSSTKLPSMSFLKQTLEDDFTKVAPSTQVSEFWQIMNNGDESWPHGCYLEFCGGDCMGNEKRIFVPALKPNDSTSVVVNFISPCMPGIYKSKWRLTTPTGTYFGDIIWYIMYVMENEATELAKQLSNLNTFGDANTPHRPDSSCFPNPFGSSQPRQAFQD